LRNNGDDPEVIYNDSRPTQKFFANLSRLLSVSIVLLIVIHSKGVKDIAGFHQMELLDNVTVDFIGLLLGLGGMTLCWKAQQVMGNSWRVGIDRQNKTELVITGIFQKIRNPTYSGLFLICAGSLMIFPTMSFMVWVIVFCIAIEFQVRIEEEFLTDAHGEHYTRYYQNTKRYIPFFY
jgi:protein-S-isoprenylcysteine O-methyltransferase Ste14